MSLIWPPPKSFPHKGVVLTKPKPGGGRISDIFYIFFIIKYDNKKNIFIKNKILIFKKATSL